MNVVSLHEAHLLIWETTNAIGGGRKSSIGAKNVCAQMETASRNNSTFNKAIAGLGVLGQIHRGNK